MSQYMTLKQRRRYRELRDEFDRLQPKLPAFDYELGQDPGEDEKYQDVIEKFNQIVEEMHQIEESSRGN
jgi:hypothetical protein